MCGIAGCVTADSRLRSSPIEAMVRVLSHRGPDDEGTWTEGPAALGARRLSILDTSSRGHQPMVSPDGRYTIVLNGEIYNYLELRDRLGGRYETGTDTEVALRAFDAWGLDAFNEFNGQFAVAIWDARRRRLVAARDRFGERPLYYAVRENTLYFASEVKSFAAAGMTLRADAATWATYLGNGMYDHGPSTFFDGVQQVLPATYLTYDDDGLATRPYYDLAHAASSPVDSRPEAAVASELEELLMHAVRLRFRSDVPVGLCLSGGLDSALLLGIVQKLHGPAANLQVHHFACGDPDYDETPWVEQLLDGTDFELRTTRLSARDVAAHADEVAYHQEAPYGGVPTIANSLMARTARRHGTLVLLGGDGLDEQWAGYDYYARLGTNASSLDPRTGPLQGTTAPTVAEGVLADGLPLAPALEIPTPSGNALRDWRYRDITLAKIPRSLRFLDRAFSMHGTERRAPFLDHRLMELGLRQSDGNLIRDGVGKYLPRRLAARLLPKSVAMAPKRPVQTPQREWLRGPLRDWAEEHLGSTAVRESKWFDAGGLRTAWQRYLSGKTDHSFHVWQWISVSMNANVLERLNRLTSRAEAIAE